MGLPASIPDVLLVIYCYQLLILVKIYFYHCNSNSPSYGRHCCVSLKYFVYLYIKAGSDWIIRNKRNFICNNGVFLIYTNIFKSHTENVTKKAWRNLDVSTPWLCGWVDAPKYLLIIGRLSQPLCLVCRL